MCYKRRRLNQGLVNAPLSICRPQCDGDSGSWHRLGAARIPAAAPMNLLALSIAATAAVLSSRVVQAADGLAPQFSSASCAANQSDKAYIALGLFVFRFPQPRQSAIGDPFGYKDAALSSKIIAAGFLSRLQAPNPLAKEGGVGNPAWRYRYTLDALLSQRFFLLTIGMSLYHQNSQTTLCNYWFSRNISSSGRIAVRQSRLQTVPENIATYATQSPWHSTRCLPAYIRFQATPAQSGLVNGLYDTQTTLRLTSPLLVSPAVTIPAAQMHLTTLILD
jgi:hypothetical protein